MHYLYDQRFPQICSIHTIFLQEVVLAADDDLKLRLEISADPLKNHPAQMVHDLSRQLPIPICRDY